MLSVASDRRSAASSGAVRFLLVASLQSHHIPSVTHAAPSPKLPDPPPGFPGGWVELLITACDRGHLEFRGDRIRYRCAEVREFAYNRPEEPVRAGLYAWLILRRGYAPDSIRVEVPVPQRVPNDYADLVVYRDSTCRTPYLVVEAKATQCSDAAFQQAVEQGSATPTPCATQRLH